MIKALVLVFIFCLVSCKDEYVIKDLSSGQTISISGGVTLELRSNIFEQSNLNVWTINLRSSKEISNVVFEDLELINATLNSLTRRDPFEY